MEKMENSFQETFSKVFFFGDSIYFEIELEFY